MTDHLDVTATPLMLPAPDFAQLGDAWTESRVQLDPRIPPDSHLYHRRTADGYLTLLVSRARGPHRPHVVQLAHSLAPEAPEDAAGRPPTVAELCDALNRFTPEGMPFAVAFISAGLAAPSWPRHVTVMLTQAGPRLGTRDLIQLAQ